MSYHFCLWRESAGEEDLLTALPLGISYADAKAIAAEQAAVDDREQETFWCLGSIYVDGTTKERIKYAKILWRLHVPAKSPVCTNAGD